MTILVVGAGYAGCVLAERIASQLGKRVTLMERRAELGGHAHDGYDAHGIFVHTYGPHIFHTHSEEVWNYLSQFTEWRSYEHRVLADLDGQRLPIPINRNTLNKLYHLNLQTDEEVERFYAQVREPISEPKNAEEQVLSRVGRDLYDKFFRHYTAKQWGCDPKELAPSVTARIPTRTSDDDRYFSDAHQAIPAAGYTALFKRMVDHPNIRLMLNQDFHTTQPHYDHLIYTGPIDAFFDYRFGRLPYRGLRFRSEYHPCDYVQEVAQINYPGTQPYTRITECKHLTGQQCRGTTITYEYPTEAAEEPFYPVLTPASLELLTRYQELAATLPNVTFCGRLAEFKYYNMDQVTERALTLFETELRFAL